MTLWQSLTQTERYVVVAYCALIVALGLVACADFGGFR